MPGLDGGEHSPAAHASELHLAGCALANHRMRPRSVLAALPGRHSFLAGSDELVLRILVEVHRQEIVLNVVGLAGNFHRPGFGLRFRRRLEHQQTSTRSIPIRSLGAFAVQRRDDQLELLVAVDVCPLDPMQRRLGGNLKHLPGGSCAGCVLFDPLQGTGVLARPSGAERNVEPPVAVDVVRRQRDVIGCGGTGRQNHVLFPVGRLKPDELSATDGEDVGVLVAVHVARHDGVSNAEVFGDLLFAELKRSARRRCRLLGGDRRQQQNRPGAEREE